MPGAFGGLDGPFQFLVIFNSGNHMLSSWRTRASLLAILMFLITGAAIQTWSRADDRPAANANDSRRPPAIVTENIPPIPNLLWDRLRQYQNVRSARFRGWSPDGKGMLIQTRFGNSASLHLVHEPGGRREQLTFFDEPTDGVFLKGDKGGNLLAILSRGGDENDQIYFVERATGRTRLLTDGRSKNHLGPMLEDGSRILIASNARNGRDTDLYVVDPARPDATTRVLESQNEYWTAHDWSSDRLTLLINRYVSINESYPATLDILSGKKTPIPYFPPAKIELPVGISPAGSKPAGEKPNIRPRESTLNKTSTGRSEIGKLITPKPAGSQSTPTTNQPGGATGKPATGPTIFTQPDAKSAEKKPAGKVSYGPMEFGPGSDVAFIASDAAGEFRQLDAVDLTTFQRRPISHDIPWDVSSLAVDRKSGRVAFAVNEDGGGGLYILNSKLGKSGPQTLFPKGMAYVVDPGVPLRIATPIGVIAGLEFSPDGSQLGFTLSQPNAPSEAYAVRMSDGKVIRWTYSEVGGLPFESFIVPKRVQFPSFDKRMIPAYVFLPKGASKERPAPVIINIHGGPEGQYRPLFNPIDQFYLNEMGIAVIAPNVRGSAGYGKTYLTLDNGERREDSVKDIGALLDWINEQPELDPKRVAVVGGSYGGYMVLASLTHYSGRLKAGVDIVGIASFNTFLKNTSPYRQDLRRAEYGDERDPKMKEFFTKIDPLNNAEKIKSALFVAHGKNDPRVPFSEAEQIAPKVRANKVPVWTLYANNEGHGFAKKANRDYLTAAMALFLIEHLLK